MLPCELSVVLTYTKVCKHGQYSTPTILKLFTYMKSRGLTGSRVLVVSVFVLHYRHEPLDKVEESGLRFMKAWKNNYARSLEGNSSTKQ